MTRLISLLGIAFAAGALPHSALAQNVTLDPGLYDYSHVLNLGGQDMAADEFQYCIRDGENSRTLDELVESLSNGGQCKLSNISMTNSTGRADISCTDTGLGLDVQGVLDAKFGPDFYDVDAIAALGPIQITFKSKIQRRGECPADWKNLDE